EPPAYAARGQAHERLLLDVADRLGRDAEPAAGLAERGRLLAEQPEPQAHDVALTLGEAAHGLLHGGRAGVLDHLVLDARLLRRDQVAERGLAVLADGLVEARQRAGGLADLDDLVDRKVVGVGALLL